MNNQAVINHIVNWLGTYCTNSGMKGFVVGISGGIDSALTSTLCALTGKPVIVVTMPIHQKVAETERAEEHIAWLCANHANVTRHRIELTDAFESLKAALPSNTHDGLSMANTRSRLRMSTLYAFATHYRYLVAGTGNKVEDFGVGFYTKYGDGGVDLSPIADLYKSQVFALAKELGVAQSILIAPPTDGLWEDDRNDEDQIGATYPELEWAMEYKGNENDCTPRQREVLAIFKKFNTANKHKMIPIPVCTIPSNLMA